MAFASSRRNFLRGLASTSAFAIGGCACPFGRQKIRLAAVGVMGKGFTDWLPMLKSGLVEMVAFCDCDVGMREFAQGELARKGVDFDMYGVPFYTDYRRLLDDAGLLGIDAMTVSTPDHMHAAIAIGAMKQGIHVYVQKPLVRTLWELDYFRRTAKERGIITQMGNQGSALNTMRRCVEVVQSGILGDVREVHVWTNRPVWPQGLAAKKATEGAADRVPNGLNWDAFVGTAEMRNFKGEYKPDQFGYNSWNIRSGVYHQFNWRGFFDFGAGAFGDMACHTMNLAFRGLELGLVTSVERCEVAGENDVAYPDGSVVKMTYAARPSSVHPGVTLPECTLWWSDGGRKPDLAKLPGRAGDLLRTLGEQSSGGCYLVGDKGVVTMVDDYGGKCLVALDGEKKFTDLFEHEACRQVARSIPYRLDATTGVVAGDSGTGAPAVSADGHYIEFLNAIRGEGPRFEQTHSRCFSDVDFSVPLMEGILVGCIAQRVPGRLKWNSAKQSFDNSATANALLRPYVRKGFEF